MVVYMYYGDYIFCFGGQLLTVVVVKARLNAGGADNAHTSRLTTIMSRGSTSGGTTSGNKSWWLFRGMVNDVRRRAPFYMSDWTDAWDYRIVPSTGMCF